MTKVRQRKSRTRGSDDFDRRKEEKLTLDAVKLNAIASMVIQRRVIEAIEHSLKLLFKLPEIIKEKAKE